MVSSHRLHTVHDRQSTEGVERIGEEEMKPAFQQGRVTIYNADVLEGLRALPAEFIQTCVTSPPYWGLRDYGVKGQIGLEKMPEKYIERMVEVFREVRRVLRPDGTLWLNMGDTYASDAGKCRNPGGGENSIGKTRKDASAHPLVRPNVTELRKMNLKPKDLVGMPWRLALALQADGWYLRSDIIWSKPNPMPESVADRPTKAHEYIFFLTKSPVYFYDAEAIKEKTTGNAHPRGDGLNPKAKATGKNSRQLVDRDPTHLAAKRPKQNESYSGYLNDVQSSRNKRTVWEVATEPFPEAHFATFPTELIKPCILAGTSERGACSSCGTPWKRIIESETRNGSGSGKAGNLPIGKKAGGTQVREDHDIRLGPCVETRTVGWEPQCKCQRDAMPCIVLDPFMGSGTTLEVARMNGCAAIGIELNPEYVEIAKRRLSQDVLPLA